MPIYLTMPSAQSVFREVLETGALIASYPVAQALLSVPISADHYAIYGVCTAVIVRSAAVLSGCKPRGLEERIVCLGFSIQRSTLDKTLVVFLSVLCGVGLGGIIMEIAEPVVNDLSVAQRVACIFQPTPFMLIGEALALWINSQIILGSPSVNLEDQPGYAPMEDRPQRQAVLPIPIVPEVQVNERAEGEQIEGQ